MFIYKDCRRSITVDECFLFCGFLLVCFDEWFLAWMNLNKLNRNKTNSFFSIWQFEKNLWNNSVRLTTQSLACSRFWCFVLGLYLLVWIPVQLEITMRTRFLEVQTCAKWRAKIQENATLLVSTGECRAACLTKWRSVTPAWEVQIPTWLGELQSCKSFWTLFEII